ncbi:MAG: septum site-determining protein MinC [Rhodocyclaceae bacterium]|nr:septum site-determining protein MinC [Rhodocyclaceae bacterium]MBX3669351.1 septum site-determining protein MinC [Rhodocyclaceae bacterium]
MSVIELKGVSVQAMRAAIRSADLDQIARELSAKLGDAADFFAGDPTVVDAAGLPEGDVPDWNRLAHILAGHGLRMFGVRNLSDAAAAAARAAGFLVLPAESRRGGHTAAPATDAAAAPAPASEPSSVAAGPVAAEPPAAADTAAMIVDKPLRSGQQVYARGRDLILLAMVSAGAEVIADGNIHVYAPLRGRALAGARGYAGARIICTSFEAELVSIAGVYRSVDAELAKRYARRPVQIALQTAPDGQQKLDIQTLDIT